MAGTTLVGVESGYVGNLTTAQAEALARLTEGLRLFAQHREAEASAENFPNADAETSARAMEVTAAPADATKMAEVDAAVPIQADAPKEEAAESATSPTAKADLIDPIHPGTAIEEVAEVEELLASDPDMLRFLRAREFDVPKALAMAIDCCKWRASVKPRTIGPELLPNSLPSGCWRFAGYAKSGMPVIELNATLWKPSEYHSLDEYIRYVTYFCEGGVARMGPGVERFLIIFRMDGFNMEMMKPFATQCALQLIAITQSQYPERLGGAFICGAPRLFSMLFAMLKPFINAKTSRKIQFLPNNASKHLLEFVDQDSLIVELGGTHPVYPLNSLSVLEEADALYKELGGPDKLPPGADICALVGLTELLN